MSHRRPTLLSANTSWACRISEPRFGDDSEWLAQRSLRGHRDQIQYRGDGRTSGDRRSPLWGNRQHDEPV